VTETEKERLEFRADGTCELINPYMGATVFSFEYRDGAVILSADGRASRLLYFDTAAPGVLTDPETGIARFEKQ